MNYVDEDNTNLLVTQCVLLLTFLIAKVIKLFLFVTFWHHERSFSFQDKGRLSIPYRASESGS